MTKQKKYVDKLAFIALFGILLGFVGRVFNMPDVLGTGIGIILTVFMLRLSK